MARVPAHAIHSAVDAPSHNGRHSVIARSTPTVSQINAHNRTPYGVASVAIAHAAAIAHVYVRLPGSIAPPKATHTLTMARPTIQPPCRLAQSANRSGNPQYAHRLGDSNCRAMAIVKSHDHSCGRTVAIMWTAPNTSQTVAAIFAGQAVPRYVRQTIAKLETTIAAFKSLSPSVPRLSYAAAIASSLSHS